MFKHVEHVRDVNGMWAMPSTLGASNDGLSLIKSCLDSDVTLAEVKSTLCNAIKCEMRRRTAANFELPY